jgi:hypothetical protein
LNVRGFCAGSGTEGAVAARGGTTASAEGGLPDIY